MRRGFCKQKNDRIGSRINKNVKHIKGGIVKDNTDENSVEDEVQGSVEINVPFNPNDIKIKTQPFTIGQILDLLEHGEIKLDTEFQRLPNLWDDRKKSRLIESLLLNLPIPVFYFDGQDNNKWEVVDGLQRISTLKDFAIDKKLRLSGLEFLKEFDNFSYAELPRELQRRINIFPITIYVIEKGTPDEVKYNLFSRINQGGLELTPQEIRHAIHQGNPANLIKELVDENNEFGKSFIVATCGAVKKDRMQDRDFATRFLAFYLIPYTEYEPDMDSFLNKGMSHVKSLTDDKLLEIKNNFKKSMDLAYSIFGADAFRKRFDVNDPRKPINKALFEVLSVVFSKLNEKQVQSLIDKSETVKSKFIELCNDDKFGRSISQGTAQKEMVELRFKSVKRIIDETVQ